jgi:hypothetical protein
LPFLAKERIPAPASHYFIAEGAIKHFATFGIRTSEERRLCASYIAFPRKERIPAPALIVLLKTKNSKYL